MLPKDSAAKGGLNGILTIILNMYFCFILGTSPNENCGEDLLGKSYFRCGEDNLCINVRFVCDGHRQCPNGEDENIDLCRTKNVFPNAATVKCNETGRPNDSWVEIMAIRCDGKGTIHILRKHIFRLFGFVKRTARYVYIKSMKNVQFY